MNIIILGAGQVGGTLARNLEGEDNEITLVDVSKDRLDELHNYLDLRTICGEAAHPDVLAKAGAENAELLIAVTNSDETNMIACQIAWLLFKVPTKIARVRDPSYLKNAAKLFNKEDESALPVDVVISPEQVVTDYIYKLIKYPGALQVLDFANGLVRLVAVRAYYGGPLVGNAIATLRQHMPNVDSRVAAIFRQGRPIVPTGSTIIEANDEVFFIAERNDIMKVISELQKLENPYKKIMIAGGGHIGAGLAHMLEKDGYQVKVIERGEASARLLSAELSGTVINADAADRDMLLEENIEEMDVFVAVTNSDSANIMSSMLARRLSAAANEERNQKNDKNRKELKVMALINRSEYVDLAQGHEINIAISPQQATIGSLLTYIRQGDIATVYSLRRGAAEALETIAHGDSYTSKVVGRTIEEITLPPGTTIGAIVRGEPGEEKVLIAHDNIVIESDDHVILFLVDKKYVHDVEVMFQVDPTFI